MNPLKTKPKPKPKTAPAPTPGRDAAIKKVSILILASAAQGDEAGLVDAHAQFSTAVADYIGLTPGARTSLRGAPARSGSLDAITAGASTIEAHPDRTLNANVVPARLRFIGQRLWLFWQFSATGTGIVQLVARNADPLLREAVTALRQLRQAVNPILDTHPDLTRLFKPALDYLKGPFQKGQRSRQRDKNQRQQDLADAQTQVGSQSRDQARTEILSSFTDKLRTLIGSEAK